MIDFKFFWLFCGVRYLVFFVMVGGGGLFFGEVGGKVVIGILDISDGGSFF